MQYTPLPIITSLYAGLLALMLLALSFYVIKGRFKNQVGLGDGGNEDMMKRIRIHGNFTEYVPILLIMMVIMEVNGFQAWMLHVYGCGILLFRALHAIGISSSVNTSKPRFIGMVGTFALLFLGAMACIFRYIV